MRRLEAVVLGLYWWNPVAWWARREVERAEEDCCDAWVVWALPSAAGAYVEALAATAVYLSGLRLPVPVGASGAGRVRPLTRRLNLILSDRSTGSLGRKVPGLMLGPGMLALALLPVMAGGQPPGAARAPELEQKAAPVTDEPVKVDKPKSEPAKASRKVRVIQPQPREVVDTVVVDARLDAVDSIDLKARVSGSIEAVHCRRGHMVKKGDILFEIDSRQYDAERKKAQAEVLLVESRIKGLQSKRREVQTQVEQSILGPSALRGVVGDLEAAEANLQSAKADLDLAVLKCESTRVRSPINGRIHRSIAAGNVAVADTTELAEIHSIDPMYVSVSIGQDDHHTITRLIREGKIAGDFTSGYPVTLSIEGEEGFRHDAKADLSAVTFSPGGLVTWRVFIPNSDGSLMPMMNVHVLLITSVPYQGLVLPAKAVQDEGFVLAFSIVQVVSPTGTVYSRRVRVRKQIDGMVAIVADLKADEWVVEKFDPQLMNHTVETEKIAFPKK